MDDSKVRAELAKMIGLDSVPEIDPDAIKNLDGLLDDFVDGPVDSVRLIKESRLRDFYKIRGEEWMAFKTVWVPRGYYSEVRIKEDDVQMFLIEEISILETHIRKLGPRWLRGPDAKKWYDDLLAFVTKPRGEE